MALRKILPMLLEHSYNTCFKKEKKIIKTLINVP